jgi:hypothetical protein
MEAAAPSPRAILRGLLNLRPSLRIERTAVAADDAVARGLAVARVYAFVSVDYPGAAQSLVFDSDGTIAVGAFVFDPGSATSPTTAFTFAGGVYQILTVPRSNLSIATGINGAGLIVGVHEDLAGMVHGFTKSGATFSNVDFPGATATQAIGVNDAGQIRGRLRGRRQRRTQGEAGKHNDDPGARHSRERLSSGHALPHLPGTDRQSGLISGHTS